jgi:hypothetical protein
MVPDNLASLRQEGNHVSKCISRLGIFFYVNSAIPGDDNQSVTDQNAGGMNVANIFPSRKY